MPTTDDLILRSFGDLAAGVLLARVQGLTDGVKFESELERLFLSMWCGAQTILTVLHPHRFELMFPSSEQEWRQRFDEDDEHIRRRLGALNQGILDVMAYQGLIASYRVDFLCKRWRLRSDGTILRSPALIVEMDGHDFHERTKEQSQRDKSRDRELSTKGFSLMRFTGSEVWADPIRTFMEVNCFLREHSGGKKVASS